MDRHLLDYIPPILKEVREYKLTLNAEQPEIVDLWKSLEDAQNDQFIMDATENGIKRFEKILDITPKATDTLDERKFRIFTRLNEELPYTYRTLEQQLITLCGTDGFKMDLDNNTYTLTVRVELTSRNKFDDVEKLLKRTVPANLIVDLSLLYNQYLTVAKFTHEQLSSKTHYEIRNDEVI